MYSGSCHCSATSDNRENYAAASQGKLPSARNGAMSTTAPHAAYLPLLQRFFDDLPAGDNGKPDITIETQLLASGVLDSLNLFMFVSHIEDELGIAIDPEDVTPENFASLGNVCDLLARQTGAAQTGAVK